MKRLLLVVFIVAGVAGCLGEATVDHSRDLSATVMDLSQPPNVDGGHDASGDGGGKYNCGQLNACELKCATDPKPTMCVTNCRNMATPAALMKELAVQGCFNQYCPLITDAGTSAICTPNDMGAYSASCTSCISNSQIAPMKACSGGAECHQCYADAEACTTDK